MKKCVVCGVEISKVFNACRNCFAFLKWKYGKEKCDERIKDFKQWQNSLSIKCYRRYKK